MVIDTPARSTSPEDLQRSPQASRIGRTRWLNPQVIIGIVLVLGATALGARIVSGADDTVPVLVAATDLRPGQPFTSADVEVRRVRLEESLEHYHSGEVGSGYVVVRPIDQGELIARSAVAAPADGSDADVRYVSVSLPAEEVPRSLVTGSAVDVWLTPADQATKRVATSVAAGVTVAAADGDAGALGIDGSRVSVTLAIGPAQVSAATAENMDELIARLVGAARDGRVYLVLRPDTDVAP